MNKIFKHVTNTKNGELVSGVAAENARTASGASTSSASVCTDKATPNNSSQAFLWGLKAMALAVLGLCGSLAHAAAPVGVVAHGEANLVTQGSVLNVLQSSKAATINFQQLNLAKGEGVAVQARSASDITLLRVAGGMNVNGGFVTANNNLLISSPNGIAVSNGGKVSAQGEVYMTTQDMAVGQYTKPTSRAAAGVINISGQSQISGSNIVLDASSIQLSRATLTATPVQKTDGITLQAGTVSVQDSSLSATGGQITIGKDPQGYYAHNTTLITSTLNAQAVQVAGIELKVDSTNSIEAETARLQTVDMKIDKELGQLTSALMAKGTEVQLQGDNSVTMDRDATIAANTAHNTSLSIANTGSQQNNPNAPSSPTTPKPNQVAILGTVNLNGGRKSLSVHSAGDLTLDGTRTDVSGDTTFQAIGTIVVNAAHLTTVGDLTIGRDAFGQGALSLHTVVFDSTLKGYNIETSGDTLTTQGVTARTTGGEWLLDPTNITISTAASTGGSLAAAQGQAGATTISTTDIQNSINAGTSVNVVGSGTITLSNNLIFANSTANATLTLDNTSGSKQGITLTGGITATGTSRTSLIVKSAGGLIAANGAINVTGDVTLDNTYNVGGTTSGFINELNGQTYAMTAAGQQAGVKISASISANNITVKGALAASTMSGVWLASSLNATNDINLTGTNALNAGSGNSMGFYSNSATPITSTAGIVNITGKIRLNSLTTGISNNGIYFNNSAPGTSFTITANQINLAGSATNSTAETTATSYAIMSIGASYKINSTADYSATGSLGRTAISFVGDTTPGLGTGVALLTSARAYTTNTSSGSINQNASGGDIRFVSNNSISVALNTIAVAANNTGIASQIIYDSTSAVAGTGRIRNFGVVNADNGGNAPVNFIQKSNGGSIFDGTGAIRASGYIDINNNAVSGPSATATTLNLAGASITGPMTAGTLAGNIGVRINAIATGTGIGIDGSSTITSLVGPVALTGQSETANAIKLTGAVSSAAGFTAVGTSTTAPTVVELAAITNTAGNISITGNDAAAGANTGISATGAITQNQVGGNVSFISNNKIVQTGAVSLVANTGATAADVLYDTRTGTSGSTIQNGALSVGAGTSTSAINFSELTNGALITNGGVTVPGYILIDNTNGSSSTATLANANGTTITGALNAGTLAGSTGVRINTVSSGTGVGIQDTAAITALAGPVTLTSISGTGKSIDLTADSTITSAGGVSIIGTSSLASSFVDTYGAVSVLGQVTNTGAGGVLVQSTANTATGAINDSGTGGISITGGYNIAAGTVTGGTITAVGTLDNTGGGVISLSMAQPTSTTGGVIEDAAGVTSANASVSSNVSYGNVGGVMGAIGAGTVNSVNYRSVLSGNTAINLEVENYSQEYGTAYNGTVANKWLNDRNNVTYIAISGSSSGFGIVQFSEADALASLRFAGNLGTGGNSNLVQSLTDLSVPGAITSSYGTVNVTPRANKNTYTITPKALTITGSTATSVYDGVRSYADVSAAGTTYSGLVTHIGDVATGDAVTGLTRSITSSTDTTTTLSGVAQVGSYVDTLTSATGTGLSNYTISYVPGAFSVTPATLTITGGNKTSTYNATAQNNATYSVVGLLGSDTVSSVSGVASGTTVGTYSDSLSAAQGTGLSNYNIAYNNGALTIRKAALTISSASSSTTYTGSAQTGTYTVSGLQGSVDAVTGITGAATGTNAGTYTSTLGGATGTGLENYEITYADTGTFTINKANATLVGAVNTSVYNGSAQTNTGAVFTGLLGNDASTISATGYAQATHVAQGAVADNLSATGTNAGNYNFAVTNGSLRITPKALTVVGAQTTVVYNATTRTNTSTITGLVTGDAITVSGSASARNVSTINDALSVAFTSGDASNYTTTITDGFLKITPAIISISGITAADKTYDGTTSATLSGTPTISGVLGTDSVSINAGSLTGVFDSKNAGAQTVTISGIGITGTDAANYQLSGGTTATTTATITPKTLNVTGTSLTTTYNGGVQSLAAPVVDGLVTGDNVTIGGNASGTKAGAYTATYTAGGTDAGNYNLVSTAPATLTVNKAALVVTADNNGKFVTQSDPALSAQVSGFQGSDTQANMNFGYSISRADSTNNAVGTYAITASNATATSLNNYTVSYVPGIFTISPAGTVLIKMNPTTSTYGTVVGGSIASVEYLTSVDGSVLKVLTNIAGTDRYTDGIGGEIRITPTTSVTTTTNAGTYVGAISNTNSDVSLSNGNFTGVQTIENTAVVNQANLTLALAPVTKTYDGTAFTATGVTVTPTGLMNSQTLANLGGLTYSGTAIGAINANTSPYTLVGSVGSGFSNYNVTIAPSTVTINKAPLEITGGTNTYTFNNTQRTNTYAITTGQLYGSDSVTGLTGLASRLHAGATLDNLTAATGVGLSNYNISFVNGGLTINPAPLTAIATPTNAPVYNGTTAVPNTTVLSVVIGGTLVSGTTSLALSGDDVGAQTIINSGTVLSGPNAGDYVVVSSNLANTSTNQVTPNIVGSGNGGGSVTITPAPLTITGGTTSYVFNNTQRTNTYSVSGQLYGSDSVTGVTGLGTGLRANTSANPVYADNLSAATGSGLTNYAITYVNGGLTITPAPLTALATPNATTYSGGTSVASTTVLSGIIAGTDVSGTTSLVLGSPNAGTQTITNNGTVLSGDNFSDYYVVSSNLVGTAANQVTPATPVTAGNAGGTIVVAKAPATVLALASRATADGTMKTQGYTQTGVMAGDDLGVSGLASGMLEGSYMSALSASNPNYDVSFVNAPFEIDASLPLNPPLVGNPGATESLQQPNPAPFVLAPNPAPLETQDQYCGLSMDMHDIRLTQFLEPKAPAQVCGVDSSVLFDFGSAVLNSQAKEQLRTCQLDPNKQLVISGFFDAEGTRVAHIGLGKRRALAVKEFMTSELMIPERNIRMSLVNKAREVTEPSTEWARAASCRVHITGVSSQH